MATGREDIILYAHHSDGYSQLSLFQQIISNVVTPHIAAATRSLNENRDDDSFVVVDYGAADGLNSVPIIAKCAGELSSEVSGYEWILNDIVDFDNEATIQKVVDRLEHLPGWREGSVKLQYVVGSFYTQVMPDDSVHLGVSVSAVHWLSQRPPKSSGTNPWYPDEATKAISAKDWVDFLQCRAKELKKGGRLVVEVPMIPLAKSDKGNIIHTTQQVVTDMFNEGIITEEEYHFVRVFPFCWKTEAELQAPFLDPDSDLSLSLQLVGIKTHRIPFPFYDKWIKAGGGENTLATEEFVTENVNYTKSFYNSFLTILEGTRSREVHLAILEDFYKRVGDMVRGDPEEYHSQFVSVVDIMKY